MLFISGSNSSVEGTFSILNLILNNYRMKLKHSTIEMLIRIKGNNFNWSEAERDNIIVKAVDVYMECLRKKNKTNQFIRKKKQVK